MGLPRPLLVAACVAVLACCVAALGPSAASAPPPSALYVPLLSATCTPGADWGTPRPDLAARVVELVNAHRQVLGLPALRVSPALTSSAVWKARHMARYGYFDHADPAPPVARSVGERARDCGYASDWVGENIAAGYGSAEAVMQGWLGSPGHRANIEGNYKVIGVGAAAGGGMMLWVQNFGGLDDSATPPPPPPPPVVPPPPPPVAPPPGPARPAQARNSSRSWRSPEPFGQRHVRGSERPASRSFGAGGRALRWRREARPS